MENTEIKKINESTIEVKKTVTNETVERFDRGFLEKRLEQEKAQVAYTESLLAESDKVGVLTESVRLAEEARKEAERIAVEAPIEPALEEPIIEEQL